ncbi:uncharacterized protein [Delphinus delphis]|uniref:uncharacterized protein isoform X1 n=1 Tax=Delphinus delphis TaxID=9728 RepID=UPI0028C41136|nr:uncharacterized protein LOC132436665 isoform X1 [Delphinus delphis]
MDSDKLTTEAVDTSHRAWKNGIPNFVTLLLKGISEDLTSFFVKTSTDTHTSFLKSASSEERIRRVLIVLGDPVWRMLRTAYDNSKEHSPWRHADLNPHPDFTSYYVAWQSQKRGVKSLWAVPWKRDNDGDEIATQGGSYRNGSRILLTRAAGPVLPDGNQLAQLHHVACGISVPPAGIKPAPLLWMCGVLPTGPPGKSYKDILMIAGVSESS